MITVDCRLTYAKILQKRYSSIYEEVVFLGHLPLLAYAREGKRLLGNSKFKQV